MTHFRALLVATASLATIILQGCEDFSLDYVRTANSATQVTIRRMVPLGHNECSTIQVVSESSQCGPLARQTTCTTSEDSCTPSVGYPVCQHSEQSCNWVKDFDAPITAVIDFDPAARLQPGQTETFSFSATIKDGIVTVKPSVKSSYYRYAFQQQVRFDYRSTGRIGFQVARAGAKPNQGL